PDLPADLCAVIHKMMAKDPQERYQTGRDLLKDLTRLKESLMSAGGTGMAAVSGLTLSVPSPAPTSAPTLTLPQRGWRRWLPAAVAGSLLLALAVGAGLGWIQRSRASRPTNPPEPILGEESASTQPVISEREKRLLEDVKQPINPQDRFDFMRGLMDRLE